MPEARAKARELEPRRKDESIDEKKHRKAVVKDAKVGLHPVCSGAVWGLTQAVAGAYTMASQSHRMACLPASAIHRRHGVLPCYCRWQSCQPDASHDVAARPTGSQSLHPRQSFNRLRRGTIFASYGGLVELATLMSSTSSPSLSSNAKCSQPASTFEGFQI